MVEVVMVGCASFYDNGVLSKASLGWSNFGTGVVHIQQKAKKVFWFSPAPSYVVKYVKYVVKYCLKCVFRAIVCVFIAIAVKEVLPLLNSSRRGRLKDCSRSSVLVLCKTIAASIVVGVHPIENNQYVYFFGNTLCYPYLLWYVLIFVFLRRNEILFYNIV